MTLHNVAVVAKDGAGTTIPGGIRQNDTSGGGTGPNVPELIVVDSTGAEVLGTTADAAATQTDTTSVSHTSILKQISKTLQAAVAAATTALFAKITDGTNTLTLLAASSGAPAPTVVAVPVSIRDVNANQEVAGTSGTASHQGAPVISLDIYSGYKPAPASATTVMGASGAQYDYLAGVIIIPGTAGCGTVGMTDGNGSTISLFAGGGTTALPDLRPFFVPLGLYALAGTTPGWRLILGANVTAIGVGKFT